MAKLHSNSTNSDEIQPLTSEQEQLLDLSISPLFADPEILKTLPPTKIYVAEHDVLRDDGYLMNSRYSNGKGPKPLILKNG